MKTMILAAGFGTRLRPVTYTLPKPMVPLCNRPLIGWAIEPFRREGIRDFIVNLHHLPASIERYLREHYAGECTFDFSFEPEILGTGGAVRKVRPLLEGEEEFFLVNGDTVQVAPIAALRAARRERDALAALTLRHPPAGDRFTAVYYDDGRVTGFGRGTGEPLMFSGAHLISSRIFRYLPDKDFSGIVDEVYQPVMDSGREVVAGVVEDGLWFDIGTPQRYLAASRELRSRIVAGEVAAPRSSRATGGSLVADTSRVTGTVLRSIAGANSVVQGTVRDSVLWKDCRIAPGVTLDNCILANGVELTKPGDWRNVLICRDDPSIPRDFEGEFRDGLVIRPL